MQGLCRMGTGYFTEYTTNFEDQYTSMNKVKGFAIE